MAIVLEWYQPYTVLMITLQGSIAIQEVVTINEAICQKLQEGDLPVKLIINACEIDAIPTSLLQLRHKLTFLCGKDISSI